MNKLIFGLVLALFSNFLLAQESQNMSAQDVYRLLGKLEKKYFSKLSGINDSGQECKVIFPTLVNILDRSQLAEIKTLNIRSLSRKVQNSLLTIQISNSPNIWGYMRISPDQQFRIEQESFSNKEYLTIIDSHLNRSASFYFESGEPFYLNINEDGQDYFCFFN